MGPAGKWSGHGHNARTRFERRPEAAVHDAAVPQEEHQTKLIFVAGFVGNLTEQTMDGMDADIYRVQYLFQRA